MGLIEAPHLFPMNLRKSMLSQEMENPAAVKLLGTYRIWSKCFLISRYTQSLCQVGSLQGEGTCGEMGTLVF